MRIAEVILRRGHVVEGAILPERVEVVVATQEGEMFHLIGKGLKTGQFVDRRLTAAQLATLIVIGGDGDFKGDPLHFRLGIEALRLGLAYEYDPYFSLSIARVDPLPHQLEAVYDYFLKLPRIRFLLASGEALPWYVMRTGAHKMITMNPAPITTIATLTKNQTHHGASFSCLPPVMPSKCSQQSLACGPEPQAGSDG
jgi:hypothetical protein